VVGVAAVGGALGLAMLTSGLRLGRWVGGLLALAVLGWSGLDVMQRTTTSPASFLGRLALWPLVVHPLDVVAPVVAVGAVAVGLALVGGTSLEASERRATLVGQIRFAVTLQDLRTAVVLRRQLAQEVPRQRPWLRLPRPARIRLPVWRRSWHGILRWPALRFVRVAVLGAVAGVALVGVWRGTTPLLVVAGVALYLAGLDAVEPLAQEVDHPDRRDSYELQAGQLHLRQLVAPAIVMLMAGGVGLCAAAAVTGGDTTTWQVGGILLAPAVWCGLGGAAVSVIKGPPPPLTSQALMPEASGARAMGRLLWPPILATLGVLPLLAARDAFRGGQPIVPALSAAEQGVLLVVAAIVAWVRWQEEMHAWFAAQMEVATGSGGAKGSGQAGHTGSDRPAGSD
jgi:hypothetical protein